MRVLAILTVRPETTWIGVHSGKSRQKVRLLRFVSTEATPDRSMSFVPGEGFPAIPIREVFLDWEGGVKIHLEMRQEEGEEIEDLVDRLVENGWERAV